MSALVSIIAKILVLVDALLNAFVTATMTYPGVYGTGVCNIPVVDANLTPCGTQLVSSIQMLIFYLVKIGGDFFAGLSAV